MPVYLGSDDEQGGFRIEFPQCLCHVSSIDIGHIVNSRSCFAIGFQGLGDHIRTLEKKEKRKRDRGIKGQGGIVMQISQRSHIPNLNHQFLC